MQLANIWHVKYKYSLNAISEICRKAIQRMFYSLKHNKFFALSLLRINNFTYLTSISFFLFLAKHSHEKKETFTRRICQRKKQGQVSQKGATCGLTNECVTNQPTDRGTQPVIEVLCRT